MLIDLRITGHKKSLPGGPGAPNHPQAMVANSRGALLGVHVTLVKDVPPNNG